MIHIKVRVLLEAVFKFYTWVKTCNCKSSFPAGSAVGRPFSTAHQQLWRRINKDPKPDLIGCRFDIGESSQPRQVQPGRRARYQRFLVTAHNTTLPGTPNQTRPDHRFSGGALQPGASSGKQKNLQTTILLTPSPLQYIASPSVSPCQSHIS